jgi:ATPase family associated with various cellular activities (AAA)
MNPPAPLRLVSTRPFADIPWTPADHFRLFILGVVAHIIQECANGDIAAALEAHPFLSSYHDEIIEHLAGDSLTPVLWRNATLKWEEQSPNPLPLRSLLGSGLERIDLELLLAAGLVEEDPRFAQVFERDGGHERRPTLGLLLAWWRTADDGSDRVETVRRALLELVRRGLVEVQNPNVPRPDWILTVPHALWDCMRGEPPHVRWLTLTPAKALPQFKSYIAPEVTRVQCEELPALLHSHPEHVLAVRGPRNNGRKTLLGCLAHALGKSMLVADADVFENESRWQLFGILCALLDAMPVVHCELAPGETRILPTLPFVVAPIGLVTSRHGAWSTDDARPIITIELPLPDVEARIAHCQTALPEPTQEILRPLAESARLTSGNIRRAAKAAVVISTLAQHETVTVADLQQACRGLQSARLEILAARLPVQGAMHDLSVDDPTREDLEALVTRCRMREQLANASATIAQGSVGVRALFAGNSGTGKTLAARLLAASLGKDLYRLDLASTVNKYLGETEKNLNQAFAAAEELDVVLLLDEGDSLMASRTDVGSANDRYANLETNFLLQRIESFDGILLVTSNAADRIDKAFARRMDVIINFRAPDEWRRYDILKTHLVDNNIDDDWLQEVSSRCALTGGQWRNVVAHARLLAIKEGSTINADSLYTALVREYRKSGGHCPLRAADVPRVTTTGRH